MTRKQYQELAKILAHLSVEINDPEGRGKTDPEAMFEKSVEKICDLLKQENPNFDETQFLKYLEDVEKELTQKFYPNRHSA